MRFLAFLVAALAATSAAGAFKCVDEKGRTHMGDSPPPGCANVTTYEINSSGGVIRKIEPQTAGDARAGEAAKKANERAAAEASRRDRALLDSYASEKEIDAARERSLGAIKGRIDGQQVRMKQIEQKEKDFERSLESFKRTNTKGALPDQVKSDLDKLREEKAGLQKSMEHSEAELKQTTAKYDEDKKRWLELRAPRK